jgi:hypothetical protein
LEAQARRCHRNSKETSEAFGRRPAKEDRVVDAFLHEGKIDRTTYERQVDRFSQEIATIETALHEARIDEVDVEGIVGFAEQTVGNASSVWLESTTDQKQRLQRVLFRDGVTYSPDGKFGTTGISTAYKLLSVAPARKDGVASPTGFEPVLPT